MRKTSLPEAADGVDASAVVLTRMIDALIDVISARPADVSRHAAAPEAVHSRRTATAVTTRL